MTSKTVKPFATDAAPVNSSATSRADTLAIRLLFTTTIFISASLVFLVQPILARMILPQFGGSPAVWNTSLVFFQAMLLLGYSYAHLSRRWIPLRWHGVTYLALIVTALLILPISVSEDLSLNTSVPVVGLLFTLFLAVGLPYFVVSASSPMIQYWFSRLDHPASRDPYWLYAASNVGSLLALLGYPVLIEPLTSVSEQRMAWTAIYLLFAAFVVGCVIVTLKRPATLAHVSVKSEEDSEPLSWATRFKWIAIAFVPSSLMVGATNYLSTDVASFPLLWVVPLSIYLLTFVIAFSNRVRVPTTVLYGCLMILGPIGIATFVVPSLVPIAALVSIHLVLLFVVALLAHQELAHSRPNADHLTEFFLLISVGGVIGGSFNALAAPLVFNQIIEYPIVIILAFALRTPEPGRQLIKRSTARKLVPAVLGISLTTAIVGIANELPIVVGAAVAIAVSTFVFRGLPQITGKLAVAAFAVMFVFVVQSAVESSAIMTERTFFGVLRVVDADDGTRKLAHGTTNHGSQNFASESTASEPITYFGRTGPLGDIFAGMNSTDSIEQVGVIGLGVGSIAAYGESGDTFTYFEIDPAVVEIAENPEYFTYLRDSKAEIEIVTGDGRLEIEHFENNTFDLLIADAFSSDAIPVHLLTREALELYRQKTAPDGVLAIQISNRNMDLSSILSALARDLEMTGYIRIHDQLTEEEREKKLLPSIWVVLSDDTEALAPIVEGNEWTPLIEIEPGPVWTDDYSNLISVIRWFD